VIASRGGVASRKDTSGKTRFWYRVAAFSSLNAAEQVGSNHAYLAVVARTTVAGVKNWFNGADAASTFSPETVAAFGCCKR
jgi:hypothetical protein